MLWGWLLRWRVLLWAGVLQRHCLRLRLRLRLRVLLWRGLWRRWCTRWRGVCILWRGVLLLCCLWLLLCILLRGGVLLWHHLLLLRRLRVRLCRQAVVLLCDVVGLRLRWRWCGVLLHLRPRCCVMLAGCCSPRGHRLF